ncbi:MAG: M56 family metallopeptidase [Chlamydiales bacterium]|nr:M56 family metallopeptidase [Chlamydiales bacterium]
MNSYIFAGHLLQRALNALFGFLLFSLLTEIVLPLFKIRNDRFKASLRLIPPLRLALEPLWSMIPSAWSVVNISIFSCSHPLQYFLFKHLPTVERDAMAQYGLKTLTGNLLMHLPPFMIYAALAGILALSLYRMAGCIVSCLRSASRIKRIQSKGNKNRLLFKKILSSKLERLGVEIVLTEEITVPFAGWGKRIFIPKKLVETLTQKELEAVVAHELEHLCWKDTLFRAICRSAAALFWWVPMKRWLQKLEHEQELACDASVYKYDLEGIDLASALQKTLKEKQNARYYPCAAFQPTTGKLLLHRLQTVLNPKRKQSRWYAAAATAFLLGLIPLLGFVIC